MEIENTDIGLGSSVNVKVGKIQNVDTNQTSPQTDNQMGLTSDSNDRGIDVFKPIYDEGSLGSGGTGGEIAGIICVNGTLFNATISGEIGSAL